jgi:hypothetical protein
VSEPYCPDDLTPGHKREQYILWLVAYGALDLPAAALTHYTQSDYTALAALYTVFNVVGFLAMAWMNISTKSTPRKETPSVRHANAKVSASPSLVVSR